MSYLHETTDGEGRKQRIWMIRQGPQLTPTIKRKRDDGSIVKERVSAKPYRRMVNRKGDIVQVCLTEGASVRQLTSSYANRREQQKIRDGFIPADQCALANRLLPKALMQKGDKPCEGWVDEYGLPKRMGTSKKPVEPCEHTRRVMDYRAKQAAERKAVQREQRKSLAEKNSEAMFQMLKQMQGGGKAKSQTEL